MRELVGYFVLDAAKPVAIADAEAVPAAKAKSRKRRRTGTTAFALLLALPLGAPRVRAQDPHATSTIETPAAAGSTRARPTTKRPEYQTLRFDERWGPAPYATGPDAFDPIKYVPLAANTYLTLGGQLRWRGEAVDHFQMGHGADRNDTFGVSRIVLGADLHATRYVRAYGELRDAAAESRDLPGGARPQDADRWDVQNAFVEVAAPVRFAPRARVGRQELSLGKERLVGLSDWSNARRTFDAARFDAAPTAHSQVTLLRARVIRQSTVRPNHADSSALLWGGVASHDVGKRGTAQLLVLEHDQQAVAAGPRHRLTTDVRVAMPMPSVSWLAAEVETGVQRGRNGARDVAAWFVASELTASGAKLALKPTFAIAYDRASGDRDSTDRALNTFDPLYASAHTYNGYADLVGRQNLVEWRTTATAQLPVLGTLRIAEHAFDRASTMDAAYNKSGGVLRAASGDPTRGIGSETDVTATRGIGRHVKLMGGYSHFAPGAFLKHAANGAAPVDWGFLSTTLTF